MDRLLSNEEALNPEALPLPFLIRIHEMMKPHLSLVKVPYIDFEGTAHVGQLVVHTSLFERAQSIFEKLRQLRFPIAKIHPISKYQWDYTSSQAANNTSAYSIHHTQRGITSEISNLVYGLAIEVNPLCNPLEYPDGCDLPIQAPPFHPRRQGAISAEHSLGVAVIQAFESNGMEYKGKYVPGQPRNRHRFELRDDLRYMIQLPDFNEPPTPPTGMARLHPQARLPRMSGMYGHGYVQV